MLLPQPRKTLNGIEEESSEYDEANKEERLLGGDRASVNDEDALSE
jgi:hypothetical protein